VRADLSRFVVTGKARSMFGRGSPALIESRVKVFANSGQASEYFRLTSGRPTLDCMREGVQEWLRAKRTSPELIDAKVLSRPTFGEQTAIYTFGFWLQGRNNTKYEYPVEVITFRMGRAIAALSFNFIAAKQDEVGLSRLVAARLMQSARG
jgi:hypothetical protein